jgi:adenosine 3'-phospho 5'-phosphosulfate transporter B3
MEYLCAMSVCLGLVFFAAADWQTSPSFHPYGLVLVSLSTVADAINPNAQEKIFSMGASRLEVTLYNNIFTLIVMTITTLASGDLVAVFRLACSSTTLSQYILLYIIVSYFAVSSYIRVIKKFGGVAAVLVATARKGLTLIMSFLIFPKPFSWYYVLGGVLAMGGMSVASSLDTGKKKSKTKIRHHSDGITNSTNASMAAFTGSENILHRQDEESGETHKHNA